MKKMRATLPALLALALSLGVQAQVPGAGSPATGGQAAPMAQSGTDKLSRGDRKFIAEAAHSGMFEVQVSQLATAKATDPLVKSYASMLVDHHTAANNQLVQIANARGVELPTAPKRALRRDIEQIGKMDGADFDRAFVREVGIKAHERDIRMFRQASKDMKDAQLKAFVDKTLPLLQDHLAAAQKLPQAGKGKNKG